MTQTQSTLDTVPTISSTTSLHEPGDHDRMAHYVNKDDLMAAMVDGVAIQALCGKYWVPTRDAKNFPKCPECVEEWERRAEG